MYTLLKTIATAESYEFMYARRDFQNLLTTIPTGQTHLILDPVEITETFDEFNVVTGKQYSGQFLLVVSSDIDKGDYEDRYIDEIQPLLTGAIETIKSSLKCTGSVDIQLWRTVEVINMFDYNVDGISVTFQVLENV
tara:strand:- start:1708 stop:2118 length:411 start_codon:yes stop_codon:yes gene_type:complete